MTAAAALSLARAQAAGLTLAADGERLRWRGPKPPAALLAELRDNKSGLLALLAAGDGPQPRPPAPALPAASPEQAVEEAADRPVIAEVDGGADPAFRRLADHQAHAAHLLALQAAAMQRPPAWPDAANAPTPGAWCTCCRGQRWWRERESAPGWRCCRCHPPDHLAAGAVMELQT